MAKLVDAPDLGSGDFGRVGSSPIRRTEGKAKYLNRRYLAFYLQLATYKSVRLFANIHKKE